jgi:chromosome partitioning protein
MPPKNSRAIVLAASKGGTGKSTIASALAVQAVKEGASVAIVDAEPQQSLTMWWNLRGRPENPHLHKTCGDPAQDVEILKEAGHRWIFVDTVPAMMAHIRRAIEAADFVLVPVEASVFTLHAVQPVIGMCREHDVPFAFVLNDVDPEWRKGMLGAMRYLKKLGGASAVIPRVIHHRYVYKAALGLGNTGPEAQDAKEAKAASDEIRALWARVKALSSGRGK